MKVFNKTSITLHLAEKIIKVAVNEAEKIKQPMAIAIVDESGHLKAFHRMDGVALISIELAQNKAYTALSHPWGLTTHEIFKHIQENPATLISIPLIPRYVMFDGGYPIKINEEIVGGLGISGGKVDQDVIVAKTALAEIN